MTEPVRAGDVVSGVRRVGADALLVEFADGEWVTALGAEVRRRWPMPGVASPEARPGVSATDVVPAARTLLIDGIEVGPGLPAAPTDKEALGRDFAALLADELRSWTLTPPARAAAAAVQVPVAFDGPDLADVAGMWEMSVADVVATVVACEFRVAFCGFAPGFAYMSGLPAGLDVPRRASPRTRVHAGAFGLAGEYAGIYPRASPGGWQLLGTAAGVELWDETREPPALLAPGTGVRVIEA